MIKRIKALLLPQGDETRAVGALRDKDELQVAAAALMVESALMDDRFEAAERTKIIELLKTRFDLDDAAAESLIETACERVDHSTQLFGFTRVVNDRFSAEERIELMEMLWQVVYADGRLDDYEASLMRRLAGLFHVSDRDCGEARKKALAQLGLEA